MTRIEAFKALFGADASAASQEAWEAVKSDPKPTKAEEGLIEVDTLDRACDFADHSAVYLAALPDSNTKTVLTAAAAELAAKASTAKPPAATTVPALSGTATAPGAAVIADPLAALLAGGPPVGAVPAPAARPTTVPPPLTASAHAAGATIIPPTPAIAPRLAALPPPPAPPAPPAPPLIERVADALSDPFWPGFRDAAIRAVAETRSTDGTTRLKGADAIRRLRTIINQKREGQGGETDRALGWLEGQFLDELIDGLDQDHPLWFATRYRLS